MAGTIQCGRRSRKDFGKIPSIVEIPNLIEVQKRSYETFLQKDVVPDRREEIGLQAVFKSVFPIADYNDNALLEFDSYHFGDPKYTVEECHDRGMTFAIPLKVTLRLVVFDHDKEAKTKTIREQRGQEVYLGELPLMTDKGTFIINGTERVVVSQLQRSAGVFFDDDKGKTLASGKPLYSAHVEDVVGVEVELDPRAAVGNHARRVERLAGGQRLALVVVEEDAGGALELADDDPFGAVDDERALVGHEGKLTEVDFLTALFPDGPRLRLFVVVEDDEAQGDLQGDREGHAAVMALLDRVLRITEVVRVELQQCVVVVVRDGKHRLEHRLEPVLFPAVRGSILLQKRLVRALLHLDKIRNLDDRRDLAEVLPTAAPALDSACHTLSRGRSPALSSTPC